MMAFVLVYFGISLLIDYGWQTSIGEESFFWRVIGILIGPFLMIDKDIRNTVYLGWSKE